MLNKRRAGALAAAGVLAAALPLATAFTGMGSAARAATDGCQNSTQPVSGPVGCGALFLPNVGYGNGNALALSADPHFGARAMAEPMNGGPDQDWMFYQVCTRISLDSRSADNPCGAGGTIIKDEVVLRLAPNGTTPVGGPNTFAGSYCLTDNHGRAYLGWCHSVHAAYAEGFPDPPVSNGAAPVVVEPNPSQVWKLSAVHGGTTLRNGYTGQYLDDNADGGPGTKMITWSANGDADQRWQLMGCTSPVVDLPGLYGCPA